MNRHNFLQFNPNCYKKHLSPFGRNVLDTLIRHWRTGFDNNENRRHHLTNQSRRITRECDGNSRSIPSIPSSPVGEANYEREIHQTFNNFDTNDHILPKLQMGQAPSCISELRYDTNNENVAIPRMPGGQVSIGKNNSENNVCQITQLNNVNFPMPRIPVDQSSECSESIGQAICEGDVSRAAQNSNNNFQIQRAAQNKQGPNCNNILPVQIPALCEDAHSGLAIATVPASDELVNTVEIPNTNEEEILTANDIITPVINFHKVNDNFLSRIKRIDNIDNINIPPKRFLEILNQETSITEITSRDEVIMSRQGGVKMDVEWDDMFDTALFPDLKNPQILTAPLENDGGNFKIESHKDKKKKQETSDNKVIKRKTQTKVTNTVPKKVKKIMNDTVNISKPNFRKARYTKVVKNWLDDVDPNNLVDDDIGPLGSSDVIQPNVAKMHQIGVEERKLDYISNQNIENKILSFDVENKLADKTMTMASEIQKLLHVKEHVDANEANRVKTTHETLTAEVSADTKIEKKPKAKSKKVVQARLAQKDGKMKFGLPAKGQTESKAELTLDNETNIKEIIKEKKVKAKFLAPIKSQISVKNVTFDVNTIDENNFHLIHDVLKSEDNDIAMILIYGNGFSQLNNHYTEETCVPEGIMIQAYDKYLYVKDVQYGDIMRRLLEKFHVICYNGKLLLIYLISKYGIELKQDVFNLNDAKIGGSLIDPDNPPENFAELQKLLGFTPEFTIATECTLQKAAWYTTQLRECFGRLKTLLTENSTWRVFVEIEMRLLPVIAGMEYRGVSVDLEKLKSMENILLRKMKAVEQECYKAAGKTFQINSTLQVRTILYDELQLDTKSNLKIKETIGKGAKSTSEAMLRGLVSVHPLPRLILEYRHLHKAHATFLTGIAQHVKDGTVKPTWVQTAAATGRIASNNPNLQAIPKAPFSLVMFPETSDNEEPPLQFRSVYKSRARHWLVAADFKHVECRVFAHAAADATLLDALGSGQDLFRVLAAKWLNKPVEDVSTEDRERTKRIVYASLYGAGARKLMDILHVGYEQALSILTSFNRTFPALKSFGVAVVARASSGALRSLCGRARRFPHIAGPDAALRAQAERQAVNFVVQGSAADLCKKAMVEVQRRLEQHPPVAGYLVLQIHDELVWEVADDHVDRATVIIKEVMENVGRQCGMAVSLPVQLSRGRSWADMRPHAPATQPSASPDNS